MQFLKYSPNFGEIFVKLSFNLASLANIEINRVLFECSLNIEINAGYPEEKIIEINNNNSIVFIMFNTVGMNITFRLYKFNPLINEEIDDKYFYEIFKIEKTEINN